MLYGVGVNGGDGYLRIGELARRTGVTPELLRAWELRYGLLQPSRSAGKFRLYSEADEARVRSMTALIDDGLSAAEAAKRALAGPPVPAAVATGSPAPMAAELSADLEEALDRFDGEAAHGVLDRAIGALSVEAVLQTVLLPFLRRLGARWSEGTASIAQEHFASSLVRGRLLGLGRGWGAGVGPLAILACPPGEEHELGLIMFGVVLARLGWRVEFLGADTPFATLAETARTRSATFVVLAVSEAKVLRRHAEAITTLAASTPVGIGGAVSPASVERLGARMLSGDPVDAARALAGSGDQSSRARS